MARQITESISDQVEEKLRTKYEWHTFSCASNHEFAVKIGVDVTIQHVTETYSKLTCPICDSQYIKKQANL